MLALLAPSAAAAQDQRIDGCYDMHVASWAPEQPGSDSIFYMPPTRVRLSFDPGRGFAGQPKGNAVEPTPGAMPSIHEFGWWEALGTDSVTVVLTTGFSGVTMRLAAGDTLRGTAQTFVDVVPGPRFTAQVHAVRVECNAAA